MFAKIILTTVFACSLLSFTAAQSFQRLGACPTLGCIIPPDQADFLAGQYFDIRLEIHAPVNGSEANGGVPDPNFSFKIEKVVGSNKSSGQGQNATAYFGVKEPALETWNFTWFEDLFAKKDSKPSVVRVTSKAYRKVALYEPGEYKATLTYYGGTQTVATWTVRSLASVRKTKNIVLFIGDGMTTNMITAARLIAHKQINGKYQTRLAIDKFPVVGHQMTHSLDSFITDSANSATALYTGHKSSVNALGVYADSSKNPFDDPKVESIAEIFQRLTGGGIGIVSTAFIADATPAALTAHTRDRGQYGQVVDSFLNGHTNYTWSNWTGPDVLFGGGAEQFIPGKESYLGKDYYKEFAKKGYAVVQNRTQLLKTPNANKTLGIFSVSNMAKWLDRNVYKDNLVGNEDAPDGSKSSAIDQPGLKEMTIKAIDILHQRHSSQGWFLMSEAASIDKQMHALDYDRALGELLELDDTVKATISHLAALGVTKDTLILVTADHGHGFDVMGSVDTKYLAAQSTDRAKRSAIGTYANSGLSQYTNPNSENSPQSNRSSINNHTSFPSNESFFPANWDPRYTLFSALGANPDHRENYQVHKGGPRKPATNVTGFPATDFYANYKDAVSGFLINGTLPIDADQGVHSLTDVPVFALGPGQELFGGVYGNIDIFFHMAESLGLARSKA